MSLRAVGTRLFKHGTVLVRSFYRRDFNTSTIADKSAVAKELAIRPTQAAPRGFALRNVGVQVGLHARRLFVDGVLNRVTNSLAAELRRKAARRMLFGDSAPFFALVGVSLASGTGILTKEDELEGVCLEIRDAVSKIKWSNVGYDIDEERFENEPVTLKDLELGAPIAKGCSAVVYAAKLVDGPGEMESGESVNVTARVQQEQSVVDVQMRDALTNYPLAIKMMFNYDVQSSAMAILRAMYRETVPARQYYSCQGLSDWELSLASRTAHLRQHPNVVAMYAVFADRVPSLRGALGLFPDALPARIHPDGSGRNMSLFLLMKRYDCSLKQFVERGGGSVRTSVLLLAQLLEGVAHINMQGVAHRDLKSDNVLLDLQEDGAPLLVISDFGCCLADRAHGLQLPYNSAEVDKGGNTALMAPEVIGQQPGTFSYISYAKSDLWAAAAIAYEIFGQPNPFYSVGGGGERLRSADYTEQQLPRLPDAVPATVRSLVYNLLSRSPRKRLDAETAANVCQLFLWAPSDWLRPQRKLPSSNEILQWLLCLTTKVLCEGRLASRSTLTAACPAPGLPALDSKGRRTYPEYLLISSFLARAKLAHIKGALSWMHSL